MQGSGENEGGGRKLFKKEANVLRGIVKKAKRGKVGFKGGNSNLVVYNREDLGPCETEERQEEIIARKVSYRNTLLGKTKGANLNVEFSSKEDIDEDEEAKKGGEEEEEDEFGS